MASRDKNDLNRPSSDSDSDSDDHLVHYTGRENSGMFGQDPSKGNDVDEIFNALRQDGAVERPFDQFQEPPRSTSFTGTARLLSGEEIVQSASKQPEAIVYNVVFWTNGFTVNDGPLRSLDDPENAPFLESLKRSEYPNELEPVDDTSFVQLNLVRRIQKYPEPEKPVVPFQGLGRTLRSSAISVSFVRSSFPRAAPAPYAGLVVDHSLPSTVIQIRLFDGTRMRAHFNLHHTVGDVRAFINSSRPEMVRDYQLRIMGFPPKLLTDETQTIEQAGLTNSVVIQKL